MVQTSVINRNKHTVMQRFAWHCQKVFSGANRAKLVPSFQRNGADGVNALKYCKHCSGHGETMILTISWIGLLNVADRKHSLKLPHKQFKKKTTLFRCTSYVFSSVLCGGGYICVAQYSPAMWTTLLVMLTCVYSGPIRICKHVTRTLVDWGMRLT